MSAAREPVTQLLYDVRNGQALQDVEPLRLAAQLELPTELVESRVLKLNGEAIDTLPQVLDHKQLVMHA